MNENSSISYNCTTGSNTVITGTYSGDYYYQWPSSNGQQIQYIYVTSQPVQKKEEEKMTEYVVEKGKSAERQKLTVSIGLDGSLAVLSEPETEQIAKLVCELLGLRFVGRA